VPRVAVAAATVALVVALSGGISGATGNTGAGTPPPTGTGTVENGTPEAIVVTGPDGSHEVHLSGASQHGRWTCHYFAVTSGGEISIDRAGGPISPQPMQPVYFECTDESGALVVARIFAFDPADPLGGIDAPQRAADRARKALPLDPPAIVLSPPATVAQLVGVPTWLWLADPWQPLQASATLDGVTATVTARPTSVDWLLGDGTTVQCDGPGRPYDPSVAPEAQQTTCSHTFQQRGQFVVTATVSYTTSWTATTGDGGVLDPVTRTAGVPVIVDEAQALIH